MLGNGACFRTTRHGEVPSLSNSQTAGMIFSVDLFLYRHHTGFNGYVPVLKDRKQDILVGDWGKR
jgi:hypothetical protein